MSPPLIVIGAGGTAGHVVPALAVADALRDEGAEVIFVGGERAERRLVPEAGYDFRALRVVPLPRGRPLAAARAGLIDAGALPRAMGLLASVRPGAVLGAGGYVAGPTGMAAVLRRIPLVLMEADSHPGLTTRLLAPFARRVCLAFPVSGREGQRYLVTGRPVPKPAADRAAARARFGLAPGETCVLIFGGSQGARSINEAAVEAFAAARFRVLHAAGERDLPILSSPGPHYDLRGYVSDFGEALLASDLVVARAGGSIFEIAAHGVPAILVPYPHATADHQSANARFMERSGAAVVVPDHELTAARLAEEVDQLLADRPRLDAMARASAALARPDAARVIAAELLAAAGTPGSPVPAGATGRAAGIAKPVSEERDPVRASPEPRAAENAEPVAGPPELAGAPEPAGPPELAGAPEPAAGEDWSGRSLHFVGIGGAGMSGLALVAKELGASVTGSDRAESSYTARLRERGIEPVMGHRAENVPPEAEVVYSTAVPPENPERRAAQGRELHRADLLAQVAALRACLAITGTHGKTTTAAMAVHALQGCGLDPSYLLGGELRSTGSNAGWGSGDWIVVEADESDRSLLKLWPRIAVLTNAELDHHATYASRLDLEDTFRAFMARAGGGAVVWARPELRALCPEAAIPYDVPDPELSRAGSRFRWRDLEVELSVPGAHNALNAAGALTAVVLAGADPGQAAAALKTFQGARRRLERLGETEAGVPVYDDYAHHPTEVSAAIAGARTLAPGRLVAVFQPHLYSRTLALGRQFGVALAEADIVVVVDVYPARERAEDFPGVDGRMIAAAAAEEGHGRTVAWLPRFDQADRFLRELLRPGDLCLVMGAGNVDDLARALVTLV